MDSSYYAVSTLKFGVFLVFAIGLNLSMILLKHLKTSLFLTALVACVDIVAQNTLLHRELIDGRREKVVGDFSASGLNLWREKSFLGNTTYRIVKKDGENVLFAEARSSASALYREIKIDLDKTPFLNWSWRVENVYDINNPEIEKGDDYPARIYVVIKYGFFPWQTRALNYIWCNKKTEKSFWPNPFSQKAVMIPVRCGVQGVGLWHSERVNVVDDYYRIFGQRIDRIDGVAIMTDSDNSGGFGAAYYRDIVFSN